MLNYAAFESALTELGEEGAVLAGGHLSDLHPKQNLNCPVGEWLGAEERKKRKKWRWGQGGEGDGNVL